MDAPLKIALGQINPTVGDLDGNAERIAEWCVEAARAGAELVIFPELALTGYDAGDLFTRPDFLHAGAGVLAELAGRVQGITALVGYPEPLTGADRHSGPLAANSVAVLADGKIRAGYRKRILDRRAGVDQPARFAAGTGSLELDPGRRTVTVLAGGEPAAVLEKTDGDIVAVCGASPYVRGGAQTREATLRDAARKRSAWIALADFAGGQDELIFEGASCLVSPDGEIVSRATQFSEELLICESEGEPTGFAGDLEELYAALVTGIRDYAAKNGFRRLGLGLSGGLDSALVAALAADAVGAENVSAVVMPSGFSTAETQADARAMATGLGCELIELGIEGPMDAFRSLLGKDAEGLASENLQARIRGNLLMALSNSRGWLVLATGNRSEAAVGYSTLYGDMVGGLAPIEDVPKTVVFELCRYRNAVSPVIPDSIIDRPPSAELSPGQKDSDSLPDYPVLDRILGGYIDDELGLDELVARGEDRKVAAEVIALVDRSEHKRRQAPPSLRISEHSFGRDRRMPLTSGFRGGRPPTASRHD